MLISVLYENFGLISTVQKRTKANKKVCWRIRFSSKFENIDKLKNYVQPYFIPTMLYKLNIEVHNFESVHESVRGIQLKKN